MKMNNLLSVIQSVYPRDVIVIDGVKFTKIGQHVVNPLRLGDPCRYLCDSNDCAMVITLDHFEGELDIKERFYIDDRPSSWPKVAEFLGVTSENSKKVHKPELDDDDEDEPYENQDTDESTASFVREYLENIMRGHPLTIIDSFRVQRDNGARGFEASVYIKHETTGKRVALRINKDTASPNLKNYSNLKCFNFDSYNEARHWLSHGGSTQIAAALLDTVELKPLTAEQTKTIKGMVTKLSPVPATFTTRSFRERIEDCISFRERIEDCMRALNKKTDIIIRQQALIGDKRTGPIADWYISSSIGKAVAIIHKDERIHMQALGEYQKLFKHTTFWIFNSFVEFDAWLEDQDGYKKIAEGL